MQVNDRGRRRRTLDARVVKQEARGRWLDILESLAPGLASAVARPGRHVPCPIHGGKDGFRLFKNADLTGGAVCNTCGSFDDGMAVLMWYHGWDFPQTVEAVGAELGLNPEDQDRRDPQRRNAPPALRPVEETEADRRKREYKDAKCREELNRVWSEAVHIHAPEAEPVRLYLARRGLQLKYALSSPVLKYHPRMGYFHEGQIIGEYPCMLALAFDAEGVPVTIHRTFLTEEGFKAPVPKAKKLMPYPSDRKLSGGYIPLVDLRAFIGNATNSAGQAVTALGATEGIETALAIIEASEGKMPVWPLISDRLLEGFMAPDAVDMLCIYGDQDLNGAGKEAAAKLKARFVEDGRKACGWLPPVDSIPEGAKGIDWLDILIMEGPDAIPFPPGIREELKEEAHG